MNYAWMCPQCSCQHEDLPTCWSFGPPVSFLLLPEAERAARAELGDDLCVVDAQWFIRGGIEIPISGSVEPLTFQVWASLSDESMSIVEDTWNDTDRASEGPFFGWLNTDIAPFSPTLSLPLAVHIREPGLIPLIVPAPSSHPLSVAQQGGVTMARVIEIAERFLPRH